MGSKGGVVLRRPERASGVVAVKILLCFIDDSYKMTLPYNNSIKMYTLY